MNEVLILGLALIDFLAIAALARLGKEWLIAAILSNLFFITLFGAKLIPVFGLITNVGNVFYAAVFLSTYLLIEHYGASTARLSVYIALFYTVLLVVESKITMALISTPESAAAAEAIASFVTLTPRLAAASISAYVVAQMINIWMYDTLILKNYPLWLRTIITLLAAQFIDSLIFFSLAFQGTLSPSALYETMWFGFMLKVALGIIAIPLMYLSLRKSDLQPHFSFIRPSK